MRTSSSSSGNRLTILHAAATQPGAGGPPSSLSSSQGDSFACCCPVDEERGICPTGIAASSSPSPLPEASVYDYRREGNMRVSDFFSSSRISGSSHNNNNPVSRGGSSIFLRPGRAQQQQQQQQGDVVAAGARMAVVRTGQVVSATMMMTATQQPVGSGGDEAIPVGLPVHQEGDDDHENDQRTKLPGPRWLWKVFRGTWSAFGAVPILCCYFASLPVSNLGDGNAVTTQRDTIQFLIVGILIGLARLYYLVYHAFRSRKAGAVVVEPMKQGSWRHLIFEGLHAYQVTVNLICSAVLFLLFCQANPKAQSQRKRLNGTSYSSYEGYDEYAYVLALLAACRLAGSCFSVDDKAAGCFDYSVNGDRSHDSQFSRRQAKVAAPEMNKGSTSEQSSSSTKSSSKGNVGTLLGYVDAGLSVASPIVFLTMCFTMQSDAGGFWRDTFVLSTSPMQRIFHWQMFLMLAFTYLLHNNFFIFSRIVDCTVRLVILAVGCTAFHFSLNSMQTPSLQAAGGNSARSQLVDYYSIRAWAYSEGSEAAAAIGRSLVQAWAALQTCRWFVETCHITLGRLKLMRLDLVERHAADVDDIYFSIAASSILAAAYASHPLIPSATTPSPSAFFPVLDVEAGKHQAFSLQLVLSCVIYVIAGAGALHWIVSVVKGWVASAFGKKEKKVGSDSSGKEL